MCEGSLPLCGGGTPSNERCGKCTLCCVALVSAFLAATSPASAHAVIPGVGGFAGGLVHPLLVPAHLIALLVLGLFIGHQAPRHRLLLRQLRGASLLSSSAL